MRTLTPALAFAILCALLPGTPARAQVNPDLCKQVPEDDVVTLVTLHQSTVETSGEPGSGTCNWEISNPFTTGAEAYHVKITVKHFDSHEDAVARMKQDAPMLFDEKPPLVKTAGPDDHVRSSLNPNPLAGDATAVHGEYMAEVEAYPVEPEAQAHPTFEYRLQRLAFKAAGATVLPPSGLPPDPVRPRAPQESSSQSSTSDKSHSFVSSPGFIVFLLVDAALTFVLLRRFFRRR